MRSFQFHFKSFVVVGFLAFLMGHMLSDRRAEEEKGLVRKEMLEGLLSDSHKSRDENLGYPQIVSQKEKKEKPHKNYVLINDPAMEDQWGHKLQESQKAWRLTQGSRDVVVAIVDTGIDLNHPDLKNNLWVNKGEVGKDHLGRDKRTNGLDDDENGFIDDVHGWNFVDNNSDVMDSHGHGTHIAGIIGAEGGNQLGISGVSPKVSLMILKYYDQKDPKNNLINSIKAIEYATEMKARIINYSGGGLEPSVLEKKVLQKTEQEEILFVAAAGNEQSNSDVKPYYPADYEFNNIISVTAINQGHKENGSGGHILKTSNYGVSSVDIAAPGHNIYSTLPKGQYGYMTGTSQATAFVTGVASLLMAYNPVFKKASYIKKYLTLTGDREPSLVGKTRYQTRINSYKALTMMDSEQTVTGLIPSNQVEKQVVQNESSSLQSLEVIFSQESSLR